MIDSLASISDVDDFVQLRQTYPVSNLDTVTISQSAMYPQFVHAGAFWSGLFAIFHTDVPTYLFTVARVARYYSATYDPTWRAIRTVIILGSAAKLAEDHIRECLLCVAHDFPFVVNRV